MNIVRIMIRPWGNVRSSLPRGSTAPPQSAQPGDRSFPPPGVRIILGAHSPHDQRQHYAQQRADHHVRGPVQSQIYPTKADERRQHQDRRSDPTGGPHGHQGRDGESLSGVPAGHRVTGGCGVPSPRQSIYAGQHLERPFAHYQQLRHLHDDVGDDEQDHHIEAQLPPPSEPENRPREHEHVGHAQKGHQDHEDVKPEAAACLVQDAEDRLIKAHERE